MWLIVLVLVLLWIFGLIGHIGGDLINLLLIIIVIMAAYEVFTNRPRL
jgi:hypothetical protein